MSNTRLSMAGDRPMPLSITRTATLLPTTVASRRIAPPELVYLAALLSRLENTCESRVASASSQTGASGSVTSSVCPRLLMNGSASSTALRMTCCSCTGLRRTISLPVVMRDTSSRSSTRRTICRSWRSMTSRERSANVGLAPAMRRISRPFISGASGLRSSCANVARNSSLRRSATRSACSALRRSAVSCSSMRLDSSSAAARWPTSLSMSLNASTSTPISSLVVFLTRKEKSRRCMTSRATLVTARMGRVKAACSHSEIMKASARLPIMTEPSISV